MSEMREPVEFMGDVIDADIMVKWAAVFLADAIHDKLESCPFCGVFGTEHDPNCEIMMALLSIRLWQSHDPQNRTREALQQ